MVFTISGNLTVGEISGRGPFRGTFGGMDCDVIVFAAEFDCYRYRVKSFEELQQSSYVAAYHGVEEYICFKEEKPRTYRVYGFEARKSTTLLGMQSLTNCFSMTQMLVRKSVYALEFVHSKGFVVDELDSEDGYCIFKDGNTLTVKFYPYYCMQIPSSEPSTSAGGLKRTDSDQPNFDSILRKGLTGRHSMQSNLLDMSFMFCKLFFGRFTELPEALNYDFVADNPPISYVPSFSDPDERSYCNEVLDFLGRAYIGAFSFDDKPVSLMLNRPLLWPPSKMGGFLKDAGEVIGKLPHDDEVVIKVNEIGGFDASPRSFWTKFPKSVQYDMRAPNPGQQTTLEFVRCARNLLVHGLDNSDDIQEYYRYDDDDVCNGFALMVSAKTPTLVMKLYDILMASKNTGAIYPTLVRYLDPTHRE